MPDNGQAQKQSNALSGSSSATVDNLQESMWRLKIHDNQEGVDGILNHYPDRPGEPDCIYYLRTGLCGYGSNCRFNHPIQIRQGTQYRGELPERVGQPDCQYFLKTGTCKFGATCKYHHPRDRHEGGQVPLNILGLPMRQEEKPCTYYMRTGACKFGIACKFHHPQPSTFEAVLPVSAASVYGSTGSSVVPPSGVPLIGGLSAWSLPRPTYMSSPRTQGLPAYMPVVIPPSHGIVPPQQGWNTYTVPNSNPYLQLGSSAQAPFPDRPEQPECQYFMRNGSCKYGPSCKYHHPKERITAGNASSIGPHGLPLRPGQAICTFYGTHGSCRYGSACKYDHPMAGYYNYTVPSVSILNPSALVPPYHRNSQVFWDSSDHTSSRITRIQDGVFVPESAAINDNPENNDNNMPEEDRPSSRATSTPKTAVATSESPQDHPD